MVGRTFVPSEDMGEFTAHVDTPQGTSLEGTTEIAQKRRQRDRRAGRRVARRLPGRRRPRTTTSTSIFYLLPVDERDRHAGPGDRARAQDPGAASRRTTRRCRRETRSAAAAAAARRSQASLLGPDIAKLYDYSQQTAREGAGDAEPGRRQDRLQQCQPRSAGRGRSGARGRPRRPHGDRRQHPAADGGRRRRDLHLP